jgi:NADH-quinone oxidoreductase subunit C
MPTDHQVVTATDISGVLMDRLAVEVAVDPSTTPNTLVVPAEQWAPAGRVLRDEVGLAYFDWLSAVDLGPAGFEILAHLGRVGDAARFDHWLIKTSVPAEDPHLGSLTGVYRGAAWHERETYEMFGIIFDDHPYLVPLLLPDGFEGHPLRKDFVLASRVAKEWPGAKEPGEPSHGGPARRRMQPPGVPDESWGPRPPGSAPELSERGPAPAGAESDNSEAPRPRVRRPQPRPEPPT